MELSSPYDLAPYDPYIPVSEAAVHPTAGLVSGSSGLVRKLKHCCLGIVLVLFCPVSAADDGCQDLPEERRETCRLLLDCSNIEDAERRAECIQEVLNPSESLTEEVQPDLDPVPVTDTPPPTDHTAPVPEHDEEPELLPVDEEESGSPPAQDVTPHPKEPETPIETATLMDELPVETEIAPTSAIDEPAVDLPDYVEVEERPMTRRERRRARRAQSEDPSVTTYQGTYIKLPRRFEATITAAQNLVRGRQLIALDGYLVFVAEQREKGMLKIGDSVKVVRSSRFTDTRFSLTGNAGIILATRVPCEKKDLSKESRIRCQILK